MSSLLSTRICQASNILGLHEDQLKIALKTLGVENNDESLKTLEFVELDELKEVTDSIIKTIGDGRPSGSIPLPKLRHALAILQGDSNKQSDLKLSTDFSSYVNIKPIGQWTDEELLAAYSKNCPCDVEDQLKKRTNERPAIVFNQDGSVDASNSLTMVKLARRQPTPSTYLIEGSMVEVYPVGTFPSDVLHQCPIHSNIILLNGYCEECGQTWDTPAGEKEILIRLIRQANPTMAPITYKNMSFDQLKKEFSKVYLTYKDMKDTGELPTLKLKPSKNRKGDPFYRLTEHRIS